MISLHSLLLMHLLFALSRAYWFTMLETVRCMHCARRDVDEELKQRVELG